MVGLDKKSEKFNGNKRKFDRNNNNPNKKSKRECWRCEKVGHLKKDCGVKLASGNKANIAGPNGSRNTKAPQVSATEKRWEHSKRKWRRRKPINLFNPAADVDGDCYELR